jgi:glycosyltransferase involved in cell wall biosynthesis/GNAT superfamily N-acetyltransferase
LRAALKKFIFRILGKDPEGIIVCFASGDPLLADRMFAEIQALEPRRAHVLVRPEEASSYRSVRRVVHGYRIGLALVLFDGDTRYRNLRRIAFLLAPTKILAYNQRLERHHLRLRTGIASLLFVKGVPLDRIFLRPKWLVPWKKDRSSYPSEVDEIAGRPMSPRRRRIAVLTPYFPYPLSHGGAVRIFHLLREMADEFDIFLFAFEDRETADDIAPVRELCARIMLVGKSRYREPRWSSLLPPEVHEFRSAAMQGALARIRREYKIEAVQVEYTMLAPYCGDILVEHDITFDLYRQVRDRLLTRASQFSRSARFSRRWDYWRWRRFESKWLKRYKQVVVMSDQDRVTLNRSNVAVIPNGVDLTRFTPEIERPGQRLLFIGSFRHFPNIVAFRFFMEQVWPILRRQSSDITVRVVSGQDPLIYWRQYTGLASLPVDDRVHILEFMSDVRPLYVEANLVLVPTLVSAGTNLKVLEAMAMQRAVVSTYSGCAGLGLEHGVNVWIADKPEDFANAIQTLFQNQALRQQVAAAGRAHVEHNFGWEKIGACQRSLIHKMLPSRIQMRRAGAGDLGEIAVVQAFAAEASQWQAQDYLAFDCRVAIMEGRIAGFLVSRQVGNQEREILNVAVHPDFRRLGIASELLQTEITTNTGVHFLEVRESNAAARQLYARLGFQVVGARPQYYENPIETGIVMRIFS